MFLSWFIGNSKEYTERLHKPFVPSTFTLKELRDAVPKEAFKKSTVKGFYYLFRDIAFCVLFLWMTTFIEPTVRGLFPNKPLVAFGAKWLLWAGYWWIQSLLGAGFWILGHEAGHGNLFAHKWLNHLVGFPIHTFVGVPYYSWRWTHHVHHMGNASMEKDENYVPRTRSELKLPKAEEGRKNDYREALEDAPLVILVKATFMLMLGFQTYMVSNTLGLGNPKYPAGTNHINPFSALYRQRDWPLIVLSNLGIATAAGLLVLWGWSYGFAAVSKYYFIPYLLTNHWVVLLTFLHHTDPTIPHYRKEEWNFTRGSIATVDRPFLGWMGRFFLHNISHDHTAHHLFSNIPFYNLALVTKSIRPVLKEHYNYDSTYTYYALWRSFSQCLFVEDTGGILFWKNCKGEAQRELDNRPQTGEGSKPFTKSSENAPREEPGGSRIRGPASM